MFGPIHKLVERCINGEEDSWCEFIDKFSGLAHYSAKERLARSGIAFSKQDLDDIVQNVFVEIWQKKRLEEVLDREKITAWLSIMSQTRALNYMRKKKDRLLSEDESYRIDNLVAEDAAVLNKEIELYPEFEKMLLGLSPRERIMLKLNIVHGKTHREIAEFTSTPINTVSTIIARKKKLLKEKLKKMKEK